MQRSEVNDFQEASYLLAEGCVIDKVFIIPLSERHAWSMDISGDGIKEMRERYRNHTAVVNVHAFLCARDNVKKAIDAECARWNA
jgi:hypothetical protein